MPSDKDFKELLKKKAGRNPEKYYAVSVLKGMGYHRKQCVCDIFFWTFNKEQKVCGDPACSGGFRFIGNSPAQHKLDYIQLWKKFSGMFKKKGYKPIPRYPVVARWRDDADFVQASIYDFQPYVVTGEVDPPANPLVVPQFCLRFNDIDNVGITGAHYTGFVMIGQHAFTPPDEYDQDRYFQDIHDWLEKGIGIRKEEITYHEDGWAGGGNAGPCMEYFSRGLELGNQVYMMYSTATGKFEELKLKVLDMGMGHERNSWFTTGDSTSYESAFPTVIKKLYKETGLTSDPELMKKFLPFSSYLNVDEVEDIDRTWKLVAGKAGVDVSLLKRQILPLAGLYSVADHSRALLVALSDGALPSNAGGGYNLRVILRRALDIIERYNWKISLFEICEEHASYLKPLFPELSSNLDNVGRILRVEEQKFRSSRHKSAQLIKTMLGKDSDIGEAELLKLYDSHGISPELIREEAQKLGRVIRIPDDFYARAAGLHKQRSYRKEEAEKIDTTNIPPTEQLYYSGAYEASAKVEKVDGSRVLLDRTIFYPVSGGQDNDIGTIADKKVVDVYKQGSHVIHVLSSHSRISPGDEVKLEIDKGRREQLMKHHTATHIINAAARKVLGDHINQAGAKKTAEKAHIDLTHYQSLAKKEVREIEDEANRIVKQNLQVITHVMPRDRAESVYGTRIYQGGAVPGKELRIIEIVGEDVEACGGTHCSSTGHVGAIKIIKSSKIQDGIVRLEFVAGEKAAEAAGQESKVVEELADLLKCNHDQVPGRAKELFQIWKTVVKKKRKVESTTLKSDDSYSGDIIQQASLFLKTQPEHIVSTVRRFLREIKESSR